MSTISQALPVGQVLRDRGLVDERQLQDALMAQRREGGSIGLQLILSGALTRRELFSALADQWGAPLLDLVAEPANSELIEGQDPDLVVERGWMPWRTIGGRLVVATTVPPSAVVLADVRRIHGDQPVDFRTTTDWDLYQGVMTACRRSLLHNAGERFALEKPESSAVSGLSRWQRWLIAFVGLLLIGGLVLRPQPTVIVLLIVANVTFLANVLFKVAAACRARWLAVRRRVRSRRLRKAGSDHGIGPIDSLRTPDRELPVYTILVPAYREGNVIDKIIENLGSLDYPKSKLDVLVLLEEDDTVTLEAVKQCRPPEYVRVLVVGAGVPQTKPRACNYGLEFARGEYVVIYDAEDRPDPDQLRKSVALFEQAAEEQQNDPDKPTLVCLQAALNYFNADYNVLTRMFAVEYSFWFDSMLPGMTGTGVPLPLGGTSNHFRTRELRHLGAWDPYNVTEDADLGLRAAVCGYEVGVVDSVTWEEACSQTPAWIKQRTRWIKGYMVTAAVNLRHPVRYAKATGANGLLCLFGLILGTPAAFLLYPLVLGLTVVTYIGVQSIKLGLPEWLIVAGVVNMILGNLLMIVASGIAAWGRYGWRIAVFAVFNPIYWMMHAWAAWRALYQLIRRPHLWEKTPHGLSEDHEPLFD